MGLLENQIADLIFAGFRGRLLKGRLLRESVPDNATLNDRGRPVATEPEAWDCEGFVDNYDDRFRAQAGIPRTDSKVCIFSKSLPAGVRPRKDDKVEIRGELWQLRDAKADPATALWECQAFETQPDAG